MQPTATIKRLGQSPELGGPHIMTPGGGTQHIMTQGEVGGVLHTDHDTKVNLKLKEGSNTEPERAWETLVYSQG